MIALNVLYDVSGVKVGRGWFNTDKYRFRSYTWVLFTGMTHQITSYVAFYELEISYLSTLSTILLSVQNEVCKCLLIREGFMTPCSTALNKLHFLSLRFNLHFKHIAFFVGKPY